MFKWKTFKKNVPESPDTVLSQNDNNIDANDNDGDATPLKYYGPVNDEVIFCCTTFNSCHRHSSGKSFIEKLC